MSMHRFVSREMRTVASKGIWKAVRMYCVRSVGTSCLELMAWQTSVTKMSQSWVWGLGLCGLSLCGKKGHTPGASICV